MKIYEINNRMGNYKNTGHSKYKTNYHLIFSTKYRRKCLEAVKQAVIDSFGYVELNSDFEIKHLNTDHDHIHLLVSVSPQWAISQVVSRLKQMSNWYLWNNEGIHFRKYYWKRKIIWTGGYFVESLGDVSEVRISEYIHNQGATAIHPRRYLAESRLFRKLAS